MNYPYDDDQGDLDKMAEYCIEYEVIGTGTIEDLKKSKFFGKQKLFVWTDSDVIIKKYDQKKELSCIQNKFSGIIIVDLDIKKIRSTPSVTKTFEIQ